MAASAPWLPEGMDPNSSYFLEIMGAATQGPTKENGIVPVALRPTPMSFPPSQGCSSTLGSSKTDKSACGSNQPDVLSIEYPLPSSSQKVSAPSQPLGKRKEAKRKREGKAGGKENPKAKKTKGSVTTKKKHANVPQPSPQSPAMCTRSKNPESPAMSTRSKRKILS